MLKLLHLAFYIISIFVVRTIDGKKNQTFQNYLLTLVPNVKQPRFTLYQENQMSKFSNELTEWFEYYEFYMTLLKEKERKEREKKHRQEMMRQKIFAKYLLAPHNGSSFLRDFHTIRF
jgi:hypothetical protein